MARRTFPGAKWLSALLVVLGLGWVAHLLATTIDSVEHLWPSDWGALACASLLVAIGVALNGVIFYLFLMAGAGRSERVPLSRILFLHFAGQLLRYLPGRIWGFVYQAAKMHGEISKTRLARANIDLMLFALAGNAIVASAVIALRLDFPAWLSLAIVAGGLVLLGVLFLKGTLALQTVGHLLPVRLKGVIAEIAGERITARTFLSASGVYLFSWLIYLWGWSLLGAVYPAHVQVDFVVLAIMYALASLVGIVSAVTPAGLGVREAFFIIFSTGVAPPEVVAFYAVFARVWLLVIDLLLYAIQFLFITARRTK